MKKKISVLLVIFLLLCFIGGCSKTPEISYEGDELLYTCTDEQIELFKEDVNVVITDKQSFVYFDTNSEMYEFTDGVLAINDDNRPEVTNCYFVRKDEVSANEFSSKSNIAFNDPTEGSMKLKISGTYSYKIIDSKTFIENYTTTEDLTRSMATQINAVFVMNMPSKTFAQLSAETEYDSDKLTSLNSMFTPNYGIEITSVNITVEQN